MNKIELPQYERILDHGFIGLLEVMGSDDSIDQAARVSYGKGTRKVSELSGLINYLMRHNHTTPFEMVEFKFHVKMPIFVARQWVRHRTANINEYSARYSILDKEYYIPEPDQMCPQSFSNNQGREEEITIADHLYIEYKAMIRALSENAYKTYEFLLNEKEWHYHDPDREGLARELARMVLPLNYYTQWYWKIDLHNLFHFLKLRMDSHAQWEIRVYANQIYEMIKPHVPLACEAFEKYQLDGITNSRDEVTILKELVENVADIQGITEDELLEDVAKAMKLKFSKRELREFCNKFK